MIRLRVATDHERLASVKRSMIADVNRGVPVSTVKELYRPDIRECVTIVRA